MSAAINTGRKRPKKKHQDVKNVHSQEKAIRKASAPELTADEHYLTTRTAHLVDSPINHTHGIGKAGKLTLHQVPFFVVRNSQTEWEQHGRSSLPR